MDDLISRQAAITLPIMPKEYRKHKPIDCDDAYEQGWSDCQCCIGRLPTAEPKKGKWVRPLGSPRCSYRYKCSECGEIAYQVTGNCGRKKKVPEPCCSYRFCPNCGARMEDDCK